MGILPDSLKHVTTVKQVFITEKDEDTFQKKAPRYTPLFRSPLVDHAHYYAHGHNAHKGDHHAITGGTDSPPEQGAEEEEQHEEEHEVVLEGEPRLVRARETSVVQLFYDLFFVANLTTFTSKHEINDTISKYLLAVPPYPGQNYIVRKTIANSILSSSQRLHCLLCHTLGNVVSGRKVRRTFWQRLRI